MSNRNRYEGILSRSDPCKASAARRACRDAGGSVLAVTTAYAVAPVLFDYAGWVLGEAERRGIGRLYFLSRDGFILHKIALLMAEKRGLGIDCRYLYTSRLASRIPLYGLLGDGCMDIICERRRRTTLRTVMGNITPVPGERDFLLGLLEGGRLPPPDGELGADELRGLREALPRNGRLMEFIRERSGEARRLALSYLEQEGVLGPGGSAFVDAGWRGTIQAALNRLTGRQVPGLYFGLYGTGAFGLGAGDAGAFLFPGAGGTRFARHGFNTSLFEVFCAAPHGMTVGYREEGGRVVPVLGGAGNRNSPGWDLGGQIRVILGYAGAYLEEKPDGEPDRGMCGALLGRLMGRPSREEAELYGGCLFSDETSEESLVPLAPPFAARDLAYRSFVPNGVWRRLFEAARVPVDPPATYWAQGSLARSDAPAPLKAWYRLYDYYHTCIKYWKEKHGMFREIKL